MLLLIPCGSPCRNGMRTDRLGVEAKANLMLLHGIFPPITTPFYPDGSVYFKKLEANVERYSKTPVAGIVVLGSTGEAVMLSDQERRDVLKVAREAATPGKVLLAGTGVESAIETLKLTEYAAELVPSFTQYDIPAAVVVELAEHPNIIGIKESGGEVEKVREMVQGTLHVKRRAAVTETFDAVTPRMLKASAGNGGELVPVTALAGEAGSTRFEGGRAPQPGWMGETPAPPPSSSAVTIVGSLKTRQKEVGFQVLVGAAHKLQSSLDAGAVGGILAFACPAPTACYEIYTAWKEGDHELADTKQERIANASQRVVGEFGIPGVKYAMDFNGYYGGSARLPLLPLTTEMKNEVERLMAGIRN